MHILTTVEMPAHAHTISRSNASGSNNYGYIGLTGGYSDNGATTASQGGGGAHNNVQPYRTAAYIIKS